MPLDVTRYVRRKWCNVPSRQQSGELQEGRFKRQHCWSPGLYVPYLLSSSLHSPCSRHHDLHPTDSPRELDRVIHWVFEPRSVYLQRLTSWWRAQGALMHNTYDRCMSLLPNIYCHKFSKICSATHSSVYSDNHCFHLLFTSLCQLLNYVPYISFVWRKKMFVEWM